MKIFFSSEFNRFESQNSITKTSKSKLKFLTLCEHIIGQDDAKKALITASNYTEMRIGVKDQDMKESIRPFHMIFHGPTGSGKSALVECHAKHNDSPYVKTEASKYTEVGYVGRDVDSMVCDLVEIAISIVKKKYKESVIHVAKKHAKDRLIEKLVGKDVSEETIEIFSKKIDNGEIDSREVEIEVNDNSGGGISFDFPGMKGISGIGVMNIADILNKGSGKKTKTVITDVKEAYEMLTEEEAEKLIDQGKIIKDALNLAQNKGIIFIDEVDKIAARTEVRGEVNREGVQRDLLPLLDGSVVNTKYGQVKTHCILFVAAGAFHNATVQDLIPELQGRFPIKVRLSPLTFDDFVKILRDTKYSLLKQYRSMLDSKGIDLIFEDDGIEAIAEVSIAMNKQEDIGARRLRTVMDRVLSDIGFDPDAFMNSTVKVDRAFVIKMFRELDLNSNAARYIL